MRFALKCIVALAIVYRAILLSQGGSGAVALSSQIVDAVPKAQARVRNEISDRVGVYCRNEPVACLASAERLTNLVAPAPDVPSEPRHSRRGAVAAAKH